jgi:hypothetical protein
MMSPDHVSRILGNWKGSNRLWLSPDDPALVSEGRAAIETAAQGQHLIVRYWWRYDGREQDGVLLVALDKPDVTAVWADSWHMARDLMMCTVDDSADSVLSVSGSYAAPPGPDWGWRISVQLESGSLALRMFNIPPGAEEVPAVEANYTRSGQ